MFDLLLRPFFLVIYYQKSLETCYIYYRVVRANWRYYTVMIISLLLFCAIGHLLFNDYKIEENKKLFNSFA
jgi:hypothetical protein